MLSNVLFINEKHAKKEIKNKGYKCTWKKERKPVNPAVILKSTCISSLSHNNMVERPTQALMQVYSS